MCTVENAMDGKVVVRLVDGSLVPCHNQADAELVRAAERSFFSGNPNEKLPPETLNALARAGMSVSNSPLFRSTMQKVS
jgi:hypothetical protein